MSDDAGSAERIERQWLQMIAEAQARKDPIEAERPMRESYRSFSGGHRAAANEVLQRWLHSPDQGKWFAAVILIRECRVREALPWLREVADELETDTRPSAPHDWELVNGTIGKLVE